jgi:hypothetical protein
MWITCVLHIWLARHSALCEFFLKKIANARASSDPYAHNNQWRLLLLGGGSVMVFVCR